MHFTALGENDTVLLDEIIYSIGGGFILREDEWDDATEDKAPDSRLPIPFSTADELLEICQTQEISIADVALANESAFRDEDETRSQLDTIW